MDDLSRACSIARDIPDDNPTDKRVRTIAHACCSTTECSCACHRGEIELYAAPGDPAPLLYAASA